MHPLKRRWLKLVVRSSPNTHLPMLGAKTFCVAIWRGCAPFIIVHLVLLANMVFLFLVQGLFRQLAPAAEPVISGIAFWPGGALIIWLLFTLVKKMFKCVRSELRLVEERIRARRSSQL